MDTKIKKKWVKALRSGKYKQGKEYLRTDNKFCCLGVLCDIVDNSQWEDLTEIGEWHYGRGNAEMLLPFDLANKYKIDMEAQEWLTRMNDIQNKTFKEIADYIEKNL